MSNLAHRATRACAACSRARKYHTTAIRSQQPSHQPETDEVESSALAAAKAKANAWYLDAPPSKSTSPVGPSVPSATSSRQPRFTPYSALSTLPTPAVELPLQPLPTLFPPYLEPLHTFLTTNPLLLPHTISVFSTANSRAAHFSNDVPTSKSPLKGKRLRGKTDSGAGLMVDGGDVGAAWEWVIVCEVGARGKGAVARAERDVRRWAFLNPLKRDALPEDTKLPKFPAGPPETDWSLLDLGHGVCLNVMTADGREKWGLEDAWSPRKGTE